LQQAHHSDDSIDETSDICKRRAGETYRRISIGACGKTGR
jgi:hypothetical protein